MKELLGDVTKSLSDAGVKQLLAQAQTNSGGRLAAQDEHQLEPLAGAALRDYLAAHLVVSDVTLPTARIDILRGTHEGECSVAYQLKGPMNPAQFALMEQQFGDAIASHPAFKHHTPQVKCHYDNGVGCFEAGVTRMSIIEQRKLLEGLADREHQQLLEEATSVTPEDLHHTHEFMRKAASKMKHILEREAHDQGHPECRCQVGIRRCTDPKTGLADLRLHCKMEHASSKPVTGALIRAMQKRKSKRDPFDIHEDADHMGFEIHFHEVAINRCEEVLHHVTGAITTISHTVRDGVLELAGIEHGKGGNP